MSDTVAACNGLVFLDVSEIVFEYDAAGNFGRSSYSVAEESTHQSVKSVLNNSDLSFIPVKR